MSDHYWIDGNGTRRRNCCDSTYDRTHFDDCPRHRERAGMNYPKATCDPGTVALRLANERADRWKQRHDALAGRLASVEALADKWEQTPRFSYQSISVEHATRLRAVLGSDAQRLTAKDPRCTADELRMDNADLARQLTDASRRRADAFDEGYDKAMSDAHSVLNQRGYLERRGDDNGNPYRALGSDAHTEQKETGRG